MKLLGLLVLILLAGCHGGGHNYGYTPTFGQPRFQEQLDEMRFQQEVYQMRQRQDQFMRDAQRRQQQSQQRLYNMFPSLIP